MIYLTENILAKELEVIYPKNTFIRDKVVPQSNILKRPDFRDDSQMLIIEFDGHLHYSNVKTILSDMEKTKNYTKLGYKIIRIPYFVQLSSEILKKLFEKKLEYKQIYPHGFISKKVILPADFNELGIKRFEEDLNYFNYIKSDIIASLKKKIEKMGDVKLVLPPSLYYLVNKKSP